MKNMSSTNEEMLRFKSNWKKVKMMGIIILGLIIITIVSIHLNPIINPNQTKSQSVTYKVIDKSKNYYRLLFYAGPGENGLIKADSIITIMNIPDSCIVSLYCNNSNSYWDWEAVIRY